nr:MAG: ORF1 [TTV-like mini virus]UGV36744.1 MAG: ORF1 [TTV-like mini virus]UGV37081.1 MAG: ORF1 [TTV-like mini virus]UGV37169.1 MAG: ORF1 [TTV-like mini virus]UGV37522.1 MAG: ORF1 [TTV-like mini virus]
MPPYYYRRKRWPWRNTYRRRRAWTRRKPTVWRFRKTIRRRYPIRRRRFRVRKRKYLKKKLKYLYVKEYQPKKIRNCKITGNICLFQCGPNRISNEWTQYMNSYTHELAEGGGGWSLIKFSLESLYEQFELLRNKWSASNILLPLVRYRGCKLTMYRLPDIDYIVHYNTCLPMLDTVYQHTNAQPNNIMFYSKKIVIPSYKTNPQKKRHYITKRIRPPQQFQNKWYFQQDLNKQPLLLLTTTPIDLNRYYLNPLSYNNTISITHLNLGLFGNPNFQNLTQGTNPWQIKQNYYFYGTTTGNKDPLGSQIIFLGQTKSNTLGKPMHTDWQTYGNPNKIHENFGNPFNEHYINGEYYTFISQTSPIQLMARGNWQTSKASELNLALNTQPFFLKSRYTPNRDKGDTNTIYLLKTSNITYSWEPTDNEKVKYTGFPLWSLLWGWIDWQIKLAEYSNILKNTILCIKTKETYPEHNIIVPIDVEFLDGYSPYQEQHKTHTIEDYTSWHPSVKHQQIEIDNICKTGPGTIKTSKFSIESHLKYSFYFKWGGCPNDLENIEDPAKQDKYTTPNNQLQTIEIQDPMSDPKQQIWPSDIRRHMLTKRAAKRIMSVSTPEKITVTGSKLQASPSKSQTTWETTSQETSPQKETETDPQQQLKRIKLHNKHLKQQLRQLISQCPNIKY